MHPYKEGKTSSCSLQINARYAFTLLPLPLLRVIIAQVMGSLADEIGNFEHLRYTSI